MNKLKILAITSHYPPCHLGGYEIRCNNIMDGLVSKGHTLLVLTSTPRKNLKFTPQENPYPILRKLHIRILSKGLIFKIEGWHKTHVLGLFLAFVRELIFDLLDTRFVDQQLKRFQPDVIYLGHTIPLSKAIIPFLATQKTPIVYDEGGSGLIDAWEARGMWFLFLEKNTTQNSIPGWIKSLMIRVVCQLSNQRIKSKWEWPANLHIYFNSELNYRNALAKNVPIAGAGVIQSGVDTELFTFRPRVKLGAPLNLLLPGRIELRKGQIDAVHLLAKLIESGIDGNLILAGEKYSNSFFDELTNEIECRHLKDKITILPMVSQEQLVKLYHQADICFFPSYFKTGFSRIPLEATACGSIVISYGKEGSDEFIRDRQNGFIVPPCDYIIITDIIKDLISKPNRVGEVTQQGRQDIETHGSLQTYIGRIEEIIIQANRDRRSHKKGY